MALNLLEAASYWRLGIFYRRARHCEHSAWRPGVIAPRVGIAGNMTGKTEAMLSQRSSPNH
jgi:hypothetical protein